MIVRADDVAPTPWKNGGGTARELAAWPDAAPWRVRISLAEIASDGFFSAYPGVTRWFAVVAGSGVELSLAGLPVTVQVDSMPIVFDGAAPAACRLLGGGPVQALNLLLQGGARGTLQRSASGAEWPLVGRWDGATRTLAWPAGRSAADGAAVLWLGVAP